jgi:hypothetical protein
VRLGGTKTRGVGRNFAFGGHAFAELDTGQRRILLAKAAKSLVCDLVSPLRWIEGQSAGEQFVEDNREGVNVGARVDLRKIRVGLFGTHVGGRANEIAGARDHSGQRIASTDGFGYAKIDDARDRFAIEFDHQDVGRLKVAVDDRFLVRAARLRKLW